MPSRPSQVTRFSALSSGTTKAASGSRWSRASGKPKPLGEPVALEPLPALAAVVRAVDAAVVLLPQPLRPAGVDEQLVHALTELREGLREEVGRRALIRGRERLAAVLAPEDTRRGDADVHPRRLVRVERDRVAAHPAGTGVPTLAGLVADDAVHRLPGGAAVVGAEENTGCGTEPEPAILPRAPRLDVPGLLQLEPGVLEEPQLLRARPALAPVRRAVDRGAVDLVVRRRVDRAVPRVDDGVEDRPAREERADELPVAPAVVALEDEEALAGAEEDEDSHTAIISRL